MIWLSDGVDLGRGSEFVAGLAQADRRASPSPSSTAASPPAHALAAADNAAGALTVKVLRASAARQRGRHRPRARPRRACRSARRRFAFKGDERETDAEINLPVEIRNDIARLEIAGERSAGAVQLLDKRWRRRTVGVDLRRDRRHRAAAARLDLLSRRARSTRSPTCGSPSAASPAEAVRALHRAERADDHPGRRRQRRGRGARAARRAGSRTAACWCASPARASRLRRRSRAGEAAPRRPHARRQPQLGPAAAARGVLARKPVQRHDGAERRHRHAPGAGRAGSRPRRPHLGDARRRHAARHRGASAARA